MDNQPIHKIDLMDFEIGNLAFLKFHTYKSKQWK